MRVRAGVGLLGRSERRLAAKNLESNVASSRGSLWRSAVCACRNLLGHVLLDLASGMGVQLLWPFRQKLDRARLADELDPWILIVCLLGLPLPELFRLVGEEIGERKRGPRRADGGDSPACFALLVYVGARAELHSRAVDLIESRELPRAPRRFPWGHFPSSCRRSIGAAWFPRTTTLRKSKFRCCRMLDSIRSAACALQAGRFRGARRCAKTAAAKTFLRYARFPLASVVRADEGLPIRIARLAFRRRRRQPRITSLLRVEMGTDMRSGE